MGVWDHSAGVRPCVSNSEREGEEDRANDRERIGGTESQLLYWPLANVAANVVKDQTGLRSRGFVVWFREIGGVIYPVSNFRVEF